MSKSKKEPKSGGPGRQLDLFAHPTGARSRPGGGTTWWEMRAELLSRLEEQQDLSEGMMDRIAEQVTLYESFNRVRRNKGKPGVDGVTIAEYGESISSRIKELSDRLQSGTYTPEAVHVVEIPKPKGGTRKLGIPTVEDRIVQQAIHSKLQAIYEPYFSEYSYGFRPGRSAHDAIEQVAHHVKGGKEWVVDIDLKNFFDEISHDRLMSRLSKAISDERLLRLIRQFLRADMMKGGLISQRLAGTPQGGPLSPLLSNIVLDELDRELELRGHDFVRYADDCIILVGSRRAAERVMTSLIRFIEQTMKLQVNRSKSGIRRIDEVTFLGHTIECTGKIRVSNDSYVRFRKRIIELTKRNRGLPFKRVLHQVNRMIRGWANYYRYCNTWLTNIRDLDGWVRRRLRCYRLKLCGGRYATYRLLRSLGAGISQAWSVVMYHSWWAMSIHPTVGKAMGLKYFKRIGLISLLPIIKDSD